MSKPRLLRLGLGASGVLAAAGAAGTLLAAGPYLFVSKGFEPWLVAWAVGVFGLLMCAPFLLHAGISPRGDRDRASCWERC